MIGKVSALATVAEDFLAHLQVERGLTPNTLMAYQRDLARYLDFLAVRRRSSWAEVTKQDVADFVAGLRQGEVPLAPRSVARHLAAVRGLHRYALLEGLAETDPAATVRPPSQAKRLPRALSVGQVARLLAAPGATTPVGLRDTAVLEFLYATGARVSEAVGLDVDDVAGLLDPARSSGVGAVRLLGKGGKERLVPVGAQAQAAVAAYLVRARPALATHGGTTSTPALFLNTRGKRLSRQSVWEAIQRAAASAQLPEPVSPHTLRHSFATHLLAGGADVRVVQELLGHASVTTTQIYTFVTPDLLREAYALAHPRAR